MKKLYFAHSAFLLISPSFYPENHSEENLNLIPLEKLKIIW